jgi:hypothetical protein
MTNVGPSVAQHVDQQIFLTPALYADGSEQEVRNQIWARMKTYLATRSPHLGLTLFPGDNTGRDLTLRLSGEEMMDAWKRYAPELLEHPPERRQMPLIIVCHITYAQNGVKAMRTTDFGYQVTHIVGGSKVNPKAVTTPMEQINLTICSIGLNHAT